MRTEDSTLLSTVLLVFFSTLMGCGEPSSNMSVSEIPVQGTERLEHHQAAHHPDTYAAAVSQIELRHARIQAQIKHSESDSLNSGHRLQEIPSDGCRRAMELLRALVPVADRRP